MNDEPKVVVAEYDDAGGARSASRALLEAGITPSVRVEGARRLVEVPADAARRAGEVLGDAASPSPPPEPDVAMRSPADESPVETSPSTIEVQDASPTDPRSRNGLDSTKGPAPVPPGPHADADGFAAVALVEGQGAADSMAASLVEAGIGSRCLPAHEHGYASVLIDAESMVVQVLVEQAPRALALLGTDPPQPLAAATDADSAEGVVGPTPAIAVAGDATSGPSVRPAAPVRAGAKADRDEVRSYLGGRVQTTRRQMTLAIVLYLAALVLIPSAFYFGTQWILAPEVADPVTTLPDVRGR